MQRLIDQEEMEEIGDRQYELPQMARRCKGDGVISSFFSCYKSTRMPQSFECTYICFLFIFSATCFSLPPPSCIQFLSFSFGADYLILYRFSCTWL